jgi:ubiquinone/menaquinone biosynthesis C-methylase UbiE
MAWKDYIFVHNLCDELNLPAGDSFWLFDPTYQKERTSEMALFINDINHKAPNHDNLLQHIKDGKLDVLHSVGNFHGVNVAEGYVYPSRDEIGKALDYLESHGCSVRIHTSHGNKLNLHNMPPNFSQRSYQRGDLPFSAYYVFDLLQDFGVEYWWNSILMQDLAMPQRLVYPRRTPAGDTAWEFQRFGKWRATAHTLQECLSRANLERAVELRQNLIIFTHWGTKGSAPKEPHLPLWHRGNIAALARLSEMQNQGEIQVVRLEELLDEERQRPLADEINRVAATVCREKYPDINSYYLKMFLDVGGQRFATLADKIGLRGHAALDVGGGSGNLSLHLADHFDTVICTDISNEALALGRDMASNLKLDNKVLFLKSDVEKMPFSDMAFDAVFCRGVLHMIHGRQFFYKVHKLLRQGGTFYINCNAEGFYYWHFDNTELKPSYLELLWNTWLRRLGGDTEVCKLLNVEGVRKAIFNGEALLRFIENTECLFGLAHDKAPDVVNAYIESKLHDYLIARFTTQITLCHPPEIWICRTPDELEEELHEVGFSVVEWRSQSALGQDKGLAYNYPDTYRGQITTFNCFAVK